MPSFLYRQQAFVGGTRRPGRQIQKEIWYEISRTGNSRAVSPAVFLSREIKMVFDEPRRIA